MSQERWDVILKVLEGPLSMQGPLVCRGPVVRMGASPGPGGLNLSAYRGLDDRQATISAYDGATVSIAPVGTNQVRMAPHPNVDWEQVLPLRAPAYMSPGCAVHLGPLGRGVTIEFVQCQRLGVWEQQRLLSDAADSSTAQNPTIAPSEVKELRANKRVPAWFIGGLFTVTAGIVAGLLLSIYQQEEIPELGVVDEGKEYYEVVELQGEANPELLEGFDQAWRDFVQIPNADLAGDKTLLEKEYWDLQLLDFTTRSAEKHLRAGAFWARLDQIKDDYALVVNELREADMPEVFAAIPYQESRYRSWVQSPVCAKGYWQFMPEVANRYGLRVANCKLQGKLSQGKQVYYTPKRKSPVTGVLRNAVYVNPNQTDINLMCRIPTRSGCTTDERVDIQASTRAAIESLREPLEDLDFMDSGAAVQMAIASHNAGYDDSRFDGNRVKQRNILPAYRKWLKQQKLDFDPNFLGAQVKCETSGFNLPDGCGSLLHRETQHYTYGILAQHFLAVCYYAQNYGNQPAFRPWVDANYIRGGGYCSLIDVPMPEAARAWQK